MLWDNGASGCNWVPNCTNASLKLRTSAIRLSTVPPDIAFRRSTNPDIFAPYDSSVFCWSWRRERNVSTFDASGVVVVETAGGPCAVGVWPNAGTCTGPTRAAAAAATTMFNNLAITTTPCQPQLDVVVASRAEFLRAPIPRPHSR